MVVGQFVQETELVVIGGGAAGRAAALRAAEIGMGTILVGADPGPGALAWALLRRLGCATRRAQEAAELGLDAAAPKPDLERLRSAAGRMHREQAAAWESVCRERNIEHIPGLARFEDARQIAVHDGASARIRFKRAILATGAHPAAPPGGWPDSARVTPWHGAMQLPRVPKTLLVLGGGPIGVELAFTWAAIGASVSLVTPFARLLPEADLDLEQPLRERLAQAIDAVCTAAEAVRFRDLPGGVEVDFREAGNTWRRAFDHVVVALGDEPEADQLDLEKAKVERAAGGAVSVDAQQRTSNPRILAAGDVTGPPYLAARAIAQAQVAAEVAAGRDIACDARAIPHIVHGEPPIAWCGLTEQDAKAQDVPHRVACARRDGGALAKLVLDPDSGLVLGAGLVGPGALDAIGEAALAVEMAATAEVLAGTVHARGTLGELIAEAARER